MLRKCARSSRILSRRSRRASRSSTSAFTRRTVRAFLISASSRAGRDADKFLDSTSSSSDGDDHLSVDIEANPALNSRAIETVENLRDALHAVQDDFLRIEKFANLNTTAVYKILKKHDKLIPATTCCRYYARATSQPTLDSRRSQRCVRGPDIRSLRAAPREGDLGGRRGTGIWAEGGAGVQDFVRTTRKYWVATEDVSSVKQAIAEHLPVFLMEQRRTRRRRCRLTPR